MPKRRMTAARLLQIATWQKAGVSARKKPRVIDNALWQGKKIIPTGKNTLLYHRTTEFSADKIGKTKRWVSGSTSFSGVRGKSWFSRGGPVTNHGFYGNALVTVKVPRKMVEKVVQTDGVDFVLVKNSALKGIKVKRIL